MSLCEHKDRSVAGFPCETVCKSFFWLAQPDAGDSLICDAVYRRVSYTGMQTNDDDNDDDDNAWSQLANKAQRSCLLIYEREKIEVKTRATREKAVQMRRIPKEMCF